MPKLKKPGRRVRHQTLTESAARAADALRRGGFSPYAGLINARRGRAAARVVVTAEETRTRIAVSGQGTQEILLYGAIDVEAVLGVLRAEYGASPVVFRDCRMRQA